MKQLQEPKEREIMTIEEVREWLGIGRTKLFSLLLSGDLLTGLTR